MSILTDWALWYVEAGWPVLPLHSWASTRCSCGHDDCGSPAKHPRTFHGLKEASTDAATVTAWWERWPDANIGLRTGVVFDVLDIDGEAGFAAVDQMERDHGEESSGPTSLTGGGGAHRLFAPTGVGNRAGLLEHVDWRGKNGYIVAPPSLHASGGRYEWLEACPADAQIKPVQGWLKDLLFPPEPPRSQERPQATRDTAAYARRAFDAELGELARAQVGSRNESLNGCAFSLYQLAYGGELVEGEVTEALRRVALGIGLGEREIEATLGSARAAGQAQPRSAPRMAVVGNTVLKAQPSAEDGTEPSEADFEAAVQAEVERQEFPWQPIDWVEFWREDHQSGEWLVEPVLPLGRQTAIFSTAKAGKSLICLEMAAALATGRAVLGRSASAPVSVIYIDMEMTGDDLEERLSDLGYGPDSDLSNLHYYQLQNLPPFDTEAGGRAIDRLINLHGPVALFIDTMARVVAGPEDEADTYRAFYKHSGIRLKAHGVTLGRLDHAGKEVARGQRGSSGKADDVDVVFYYEAVDKVGHYRLERTHARMSWVPPEVKLTRQDEPVLRHVLDPDAWPEGTAAVAWDLEELKVPLDASVRMAASALRKEGKGRRQAVVMAALKYRQMTTDDPGHTSDKNAF